jgi:hypothetical protein
LKDKITFVVAILAVIAAVLVLFSGGGGGRVYDCGMAEWHPDIPAKVKEECRRRALEYWREQQENSKSGRPYV